MKNARLEEFRQVAYKYLGRAKDATFELTYAILLTRNVYSLADLSLSPVFRRKWSSIYEALQDSRPQRQKLMQLYIKQIPVEGRPLLATPKECERWSDLMPFMSWELWLARDIVTDNPLPWQKSLDNLTLGRVAQAMGGVFAVIGTPALPPKPRGKSPGWEAGKKRHRKNRCPIVKKTVTLPRKEASVAV